jgi:phosphopantetheine--protein transferase-like protein
MIGNDIVCLSTANQSKHVGSKRFLNKVFTDEEQELIANSFNEKTSIWKLWAVKESAYKLFVQKGFQTEFAPQKINCKKVNENFVVSLGNCSIRVDCTANTQFVYAQTISTKSKVESVCLELDGATYRMQSEQVELALKQRASEIYQLDIRNIQLKKSKSNIPILTYKNTHLPLSISLTHHGNFGAFAMVFV